MLCGHECYMVGGPWISENPNCPVHGANKVCAEDTIHELKVMLDKLINAAYDIGGEHVTGLVDLFDTADKAYILLVREGYYQE